MNQPTKVTNKLITSTIVENSLKISFFFIFFLFLIFIFIFMFYKLYRYFSI